MITPRWRKVLQDLWRNKTRTLLVILSIAVGVFAVGMLSATRYYIDRDMNGSYRAINPQSIEIGTDPFDDDLVATVRHMPEVGAVEGRAGTSVRLQLPNGDWKDLNLGAIADYHHMQVNKLTHLSGAWPPGKKELLMERDSLRASGWHEGDIVTVETPDRKQHEMRISGVLYNPNLPPVAFFPNIFGYINFDTLQWLTGSRDYTSLEIVVKDHPMDRAHIQEVNDKVQDRIKASGRSVHWIWLPTPGKHPAADVLEPLMMLLQSLGFFTLILSGFLVINTISAIMTEQMRQIGMMKAVGGRRSQLLGMYFGLVIGFGLLSLAVAMPLGALGARGFTSFIAHLLNVDITSWAIPRSVVLTEVIVSLLVPLVAALFPILQGTRISVREAISDYGVGKSAARRGLLDRMVDSIRSLPRPLLLSLRNTFRRKGRLLRTLIVLTLGGAIFISVLCVRDSLLLTLDQALQYYNYDVSVDFKNPQRLEVLKDEASRVPGVVKSESWAWRSVQRKHADGNMSKGYQFIAMPPDSTFILPRITAGRWLVPGDENAVVLNTTLLKDEPDIKVGDQIALKLGGRETTWHVVGIVRGMLSDQIFYVPYTYYSELVSQVDRGTGLMVQMDRHDVASQKAMEQALKKHFDDEGIEVTSTENLASIRDRIAMQFNLIVVFLLIMSVLIAVVGGLGLTGTMSINVLERTREIGVMRAIGASSRSILQIVIVEGILIGMVSWAVGAVLAVPISQLLSYSVGMAMLKTPLVYTFSTRGLLLWLGIVVLLASVSSLLPAWRASRLSVRQVLAYE